MAKITTKQIAELIAQSESGRITSESLQRFIETPSMVLGPNNSPEDALIQWVRIYGDEFGIELGMGIDELPAKPEEGRWRLIVVAQGVTIEQVFQKCGEKFTVWKYTENDLDEFVTKNDRTSVDGSYGVWVRDVIEADDQLKNMSANTLAKKKVSCITLLERLLFELMHFIETGKHLDVSNWTLCTGSRGSGGDVPRVSFRDGEMRVHWSGPGDALDAVRARQVVSK